MPIDPAQLGFHEPPEEPRRGLNWKLIAAAVAVLVVEIAWFIIALDERSLAGPFIVIIGVLTAIYLVVVAYIGFQEDGLIGVWARTTSPFSCWFQDELPGPAEFFSWVVILGIIFGVILRFKHGIMP